MNNQGEDVDQNGQEQGEVIVKGESILNKRIANNYKTSTDGWLRTGDQGTIDENGHINIIEPNKDLRNNDGEKVSSFEIESILSKHPNIQEVVLIATPDIKLGEVLHAFVVLHESDTLTEPELINFAQKYLSPPNCPKKVTFMSEFPKTASGKILKVQLKNLK